jgi:uncharacterized protein YyaL (SSP411 family)
MLNSLAQAAAILAEPRYAEAAQKAGHFLVSKMRGADGRLFRTYSAGKGAKLNGYLEDYAFLINALVSVYEMDFDSQWIREATSLSEVLLEEFWDNEAGGFYFTGKSHEALISRTKDPHDSSTPSGNSVAVMALLRLAKITGRADLLEKATTTLELFGGLMSSSPMASAQMLIGLDFLLGPVQEFAVIGPKDASATRQALGEIRRGFLPNKVLAWAEDAKAAQTADLPLLQGKKPAGDVTIYICQNYTCREPIVGLEGLKTALAKLA